MNKIKFSVVNSAENSNINTQLNKVTAQDKNVFLKQTLDLTN